MENRIIKR